LTAFQWSETKEGRAVRKAARLSVATLLAITVAAAQG